MEFVELDRKFQELDPSSKPEEAAMRSYTLNLLSPGKELLSWDDLLEHRIVAILGEPGSGKTWEFKNKVKALQCAGQESFSIPLDEVVLGDFNSALGAEQQERFESWKDGFKEAIFFLDSVDEAKFRRPTDFHIALKRFREALGDKALKRARVFISSRISEWQPQADAFEFRSQLRTSARNQDEPAGAQDDERKVPLFVVAIQPLNRDAIIRFVSAMNLENAEGFVAALDEKHAWEFARRPIDVVWLAQYWSDNHQLGSLTQLVEFTLSKHLQPSERENRDPLSVGQARLGVEALGAASAFCRQFNYKVPDDMYLVSDAMDARRCLSEDWTQEHYKALLSRPIFEIPHYGRIRFHHRRIAEYLAAKWMEKRVNDGCLPTPDLLDLFFEKAGERLILRPSLEPVAAWLCCGTMRWNNDFRSWVAQADPSIHLQFGDPEELLIEYKRKILHAMVKQYEGRSYAWIESLVEELKRFTDPALSDDIAAIIRDRSITQNLRSEMLQLVRYGQLVNCLDAAFEIITSEDEPDSLKSYAAAAIRDAGNEGDKTRLVEIAKTFANIPNRLFSVIFEAAYPRALSARELKELLLKTDPIREFSVDIPYYLKTHIKSAADPSDAGALLNQLLELLQTPPLMNLRGPSIQASQRFIRLVEVIPDVVSILLRKENLTSEEIRDLGAALLLLNNVRYAGATGLSQLRKIKVDNNPEIRRACFWQLVDQIRSSRQTEIHLIDYSDTLGESHKDLEWLLQDIADRTDPKDKELCLSFALNLWHSSGRPWHDQRRIVRAVKGNEPLKEQCQQFFAKVRWIWLRSLRFRYVDPTIGSRWWWKRIWQNLTEKIKWWRGQWRLLKNLNKLASGVPMQTLCNLILEIDGGSLQQWTRDSWQDLGQRRWNIVAKAVRNGCKAAWRSFNPPLPHINNSNNTDQRIIVGLNGIQASIADDELDFSTISEDDAHRAARYALHEMNGFPSWFALLANRKPQIVGQILTECIQNEWQIPANRENAHRLIYKLACSKDRVVSIVEEQLLDLLDQGDPPNRLILRFALVCLCKLEHPPIKKLSEIAKRRVRELTIEDQGFILWMAVLIQTDAGEAIDILREILQNCPDPKEPMIGLCSVLQNRHFKEFPLIAFPSYQTPEYITKMILVVYQYVKPSEDIDRSGTGVYSPEARDDAQIFRAGLLESLSKNDTAQAKEQLKQLSEEPILSGQRDYIFHLLDQMYRRMADLAPWRPEDVGIFANEHETDPVTDRDLFKIACKRLRDIKFDVEKSDNSLRNEIQAGALEMTLRQWLQRKLQDRSHQRYTIPQEAEIDLQQRPDLRFENPRTNPVSMEIKWADSWSLRVLLERLENQLIGQYLRAHNSRYGIFFLGTIEPNRHWDDLNDRPGLTFDQIVKIVSDRARELVEARPDVEDIAVVAINFRDPRTN